MPLRIGLPKFADPQRRYVDECRGFDPVEHGRRNTDVGDVNLSAMQASRQKKVPWLAAEEGDRVRRIDGASHFRAGGAVDAARQIDCNDRQPRAVHRVDRLRG